MATPDSKVAEEAFKEGQKTARATTELANVKKENEVLAKAAAQLKRGYEAALERPNRVHISVAIGTGAAGVALGFKANQVLEAKTATWLNEETGEKTFTGKAVQHAVVPTLGLGLAIAGAFVRNGAVSSAIMGGGAGLAVGSFVRSALVPAASEP